MGDQRSDAKYGGDPGFLDAELDPTKQLPPLNCVFDGRTLYRTDNGLGAGGTR